MMKLVRLKPLKMPKKNAVKAKDVIKSTPVSTAPKPMKIHGHTTIVLTDPKTGEQEVHEDDNMMTDGLERYFENCGFLNYPNVDQNNLVPDLLGGIMGFDTALDETKDSFNQTLVKVPAGATMTFNGSILNSQIVSDVSELGTYVANQSGWQDDGSYIETYDFSMEQGNGTIACVCLTGKNYGLIGEGNAASKVASATKANIANLSGTQTSYSGVQGFVFDVSLEDSSVWALDVSTVAETGKAMLRNYRLPIKHINVKGTQTAPIILSEQEISVPENMVPYCTPIRGYDSGDWYPLMCQTELRWPLIWNHPTANSTGDLWGNGFTQYLWKYNMALDEWTEEVLLNTSGEDLNGLGAAYFDGNYAFFVNSYSTPYPGRLCVDSRYIYILNRTTKAIVKVANPVGVLAQAPTRYTNSIENPFLKTYDAGWDLYHNTHQGRIITSGARPVMVDATITETGSLVTGVCYPTNASGGNGRLYEIINASGETYDGKVTKDGFLIRHSGTALYRDQGYIATINNLATPVVKDNTRTMRVIYRLTFEEEEEE